MNGMEMMLKALGIDPEEIKKAMFGTVAAVMDGIKTLNNRAEETNARLSRIEEHLGIDPLENANGHAQELLPPVKRAQR